LRFPFLFSRVGDCVLPRNLKAKGRRKRRRTVWRPGRSGPRNTTTGRREVPSWFDSEKNFLILQAFPIRPRWSINN